MPQKTVKKGTRRTRPDNKKEVNAVKNAQSWSIDLIVGVIIFMLIIAIFYALLTSRNEPELEDLEEDSRAVMSRIASDEAIIKDGVVDQEKFDELCKKSYDEVKAELGIESDFCIYIEDHNGNIIPCGLNKAGIGNAEDVFIGDSVACGQII